jgi:hypothetical protein
MRCYLKAVADDSAAELKVALPEPPYEPGNEPNADAFTFTRDARHGEATVTFTQNQVNDSSCEASIRYADGKVDVQELQLADPMSVAGWRAWTVDDHGATP